MTRPARTAPSREPVTAVCIPHDTDAGVVPLPLAIEDVEFLRHCLHNAADRWREAITEADAGATGPQRAGPVEPGHITVEPSPAGFRAARRLFAAELDRVQRLAAVLERHISQAKAVEPDEVQP